MDSVLATRVWRLLSKTDHWSQVSRVSGEAGLGHVTSPTGLAVLARAAGPRETGPGPQMLLGAGQGETRCSRRPSGTDSSPPCPSGPVPEAHRLLLPQPQRAAPAPCSGVRLDRPLPGSGEAALILFRSGLSRLVFLRHGINEVVTVLGIRWKFLCLEGTLCLRACSVLCGSEAFHPPVHQPSAPPPLLLFSPRRSRKLLRGVLSPAHGTSLSKAPSSPEITSSLELLHIVASIRLAPR